MPALLPPGILVESPTRFGEGDPPGPSVEERDSKLFFEDGNSLAHGRLSQAEAARRGGEAPLLRRSNERGEVRQLRKAGGGEGFGHHRDTEAKWTRARFPP